MELFLTGVVSEPPNLTNRYKQFNLHLQVLLKLGFFLGFFSKIIFFLPGKNSLSQSQWFKYGIVALVLLIRKPDAIQYSLLLNLPPPGFKTLSCRG